mgnify:CR=1 FL=1
MKNLIKLEDTAFFLLSLYFFLQLDISWWWYAAFILVPDIGMIGYAMNKSIGAVTYNIFHHRGIAVLLLLISWYSHVFWLEVVAVILLSHGSLDRIFDYGLKYKDDFKHTHMQEL